MITAIRVSIPWSALPKRTRKFVKLCLKGSDKKWRKIMKSAKITTATVKE